jgi:hypothetical protein
MDLAWRDVCGLRLMRHGLTASSTAGTAAGAAAAMCGVHAQVLSAAEVSVGLRLPAATRTTVQDALWTDHSLIKTFGPRGTIHLLPAADLARWCGALSALPAPVHPAAIRFTDAQTDELVAAIGDVLADAELTVDELTAALADQVGAWAVEPVMPAFRTMWPRWRLITQIAAHRGVLCFGPNKGRNVTYTNPARWLPGFASTPAAEATSWLLQRYLHSYGPSTPQHFARWLGTKPAWARAAFATIPSTEMSLQGSPVWTADRDELPAQPAEGVLLLPHFDAFVVGSQPRELLFPGAAWDRALHKGQAGNYPVLLIDGAVAGVWQQKKAGTQVTITVEPLRALTKRHLTLVETQVERIGAILQARPTLIVGPITAGAHA